jgi:hypothetical protein
MFRPLKIRDLDGACFTGSDMTVGLRRLGRDVVVEPDQNDQAGNENHFSKNFNWHKVSLET